MTARLDTARTRYDAALARLDELELARQALVAQLEGRTPNVYEIVVAGPMSPAFLVANGENEYVVSAHARLYLVSELARVAPVFTGVPVFYRHEGSGLLIRTRVSFNSDKNRVGHLEQAWWNADTREIRARLRVTSDYWQRQFSQKNERFKYGFSMDVNVKDEGTNGVEIVRTITSIFSLDLEQDVALGGRFVDAPPLDKEALANKYEHFLFIHQQRSRET